MDGSGTCPLTLMSPDPNYLTLYWWFTRQQSLYQVAADKSRSPSHENPLPVQFHIIFQHILKQLINNYYWCDKFRKITSISLIFNHLQAFCDFLI